MNLSEIQRKLKAPKGQFNKFGGFNYRSCEDILEAVKKILPEDGHVTLSDEIVEVGGRVYVKATATYTCGDKTYSTTAFAREAEQKKGMDESQVTGTASSYARKYAMNGLFAIDDTKDADTDEHRGSGRQEAAPPPQRKPAPKQDKPAPGTYEAEVLQVKPSKSGKGYGVQFGGELCCWASTFSDTDMNFCKANMGGKVEVTIVEKNGFLNIASVGDINVPF